MSEEARIPRLHDEVLVGGEEFEIYAIIGEEQSVVLAEPAGERVERKFWILRHAKLVWLHDDVWQAEPGPTLEPADGPGEEE